MPNTFVAAELSGGAAITASPIMVAAAINTVNWAHLVDFIANSDSTD